MKIAQIPVFYTQSLPTNFREQLKRNCNLGEYFLEVNFGDLKLYDEQAAMKLKNAPLRFTSAVRGCFQILV